MRHLKSFHVFHVAATSQSYSEAAKKLNITHGAVSKQIKVLEDYLTHSLFTKQGRNVELTRQGQTLKGYTEQAFQILESGIKKLEQERQQCLEVSCEPTLTMRWLMPRLAEFNEGFNADVRLATAGDSINLGANGLSLAIRRDDFITHQDCIKTPLVKEHVGPVFSPDHWQYVKSQLPQIKLLHSQTRPNAWSDWAMSCPQHVFMQTALTNSTQQSFGHFYFSIQAAVDGLGAALGSYPLVMDDLKRGNLVAPFGFVPTGHYYVLLSEDKTNTELEQRFSDWLQEQMSHCLPME